MGPPLAPSSTGGLKQAAKTEGRHPLDAEMAKYAFIGVQLNKNALKQNRKHSFPLFG
jgi:hypothetical protein